MTELIELRETDFVTIDTIGPPGQRTFYFQAAEGGTLITLIIEKEQAAALSLAIQSLLEQYGQADDKAEPADLSLIQPVEPLFRVGRLGLNYNRVEGRLGIIAEELTEEKQGSQVHVWISHAQMAALAHQAAIAFASGRPVCPLCNEPIDPDGHVCVKDNGRKSLM